MNEMIWHIAISSLMFAPPFGIGRFCAATLILIKAVPQRDGHNRFVATIATVPNLREPATWGLAYTGCQRRLLEFSRRIAEKATNQLG
ncbi:MAG: hypothetical protein ACLPTZ_08520 [Beijerinckiaceae bacterium]